MKDKKELLVISLSLILLLLTSIILYDNYSTRKANEKLKKEKYNIELKCEKLKEEKLNIILKK